MTVFAELRHDGELIITLDGHYTVDEFCDTLREGVALGPAKELCIDLSNSEQRHSTAELELMAGCVSEFFARAEVIVNDLLRFGLARAMAAHAQGRDTDITVRFEDL